MIKTRLFSLSLMLLGAVSGFSQSDQFKFTPKDSVQQREYDEFLNTTKAERELDDSLSYLETKMYFEFNGNEEPLKPYVAKKKKARQRHTQAIYRFIERHPRYVVSAAYVKYMYYQSFKYTAEEYDYWTRLVSECPDTSYTNFMQRNLDLVSRYTIGASYTDVEGLTPKGEVNTLSQLMEPGKYTLIDFWASWCGPCRQAIPGVKAMTERYADRLQVVSISVDEKEGAWRKAEKEEAMNWPQLWGGGERMEKTAQAYWIQAIPRLVLVSPDGKIICVSNKPQDIEETLSQTLVVSAQIPGIKKGARVRLTTTDDRKKDLAETVAEEGRFLLRCRVGQPVYVQLRIDDQPSYAEGEYPKDRGVELCLEPGQDVTVSAACFDSIPRIWEMNGNPYRKTSNVTVTGGIQQQHFAAYQRFIRDAALRHWQANYDWRNAAYGIDQPADTTKAHALEPSVREAEETLRTVTGRFITDHSDYGISLRLQQEQMESLFKYTDTELDQLLERFSCNEDTLRYEAFQEQIRQLRKYTKGTPYTDLDVLTPEGKRVHLSDFIRTGTPVFVDFWASWCGPCRSAIPKVKEMVRKYGDKLTVLSVSVDRDEKAWRRAMDEEQMSWQQLLIPQQGMKALADGYQVNSIPYLLVINAEGRVVMSSHSPEEVHQVVASMCE
ncbi:MAG: TlpA family protein disulfide reductase [Prevotella sp.]|nr:TlpA family protein disulfide reductase [Prevotella sp.]